MTRISGVMAPLLAMAAIGASAAASADNLLGFYLGAGAGESTVRSDRNDGFYGGYGDDAHHTAWKAIAGIRPIPILGAELEYIDFGGRGDDGFFDDDYFYTASDSHPRAGAAFLVGYLPIPLPFLDIYAKAGAARLKTDVDSFVYSSCPLPAADSCTGEGLIRRTVWETKPAYGAGVSSRFWGLTVRGEYERITSHYGDPDLFSVSATWTF